MIFFLIVLNILTSFVIKMFKGLACVGYTVSEL